MNVFNAAFRRNILRLEQIQSGAHEPRVPNTASVFFSIYQHLKCLGDFEETEEDIMNFISKVNFSVALNWHHVQIYIQIRHFILDFHVSLQQEIRLSI